VHFVFFSLTSAVCAALLSLLWAAKRTRWASVRGGLSLVAGAFLGNLPGFLLNIWDHGSPGSAVAHTFIGQVLYGVDEFDFFNTYAAHPLPEILRDDLGQVFRLMGARVKEELGLVAVPLGAALVTLLLRKRWPALVVRRMLLLSAMGVAYFSLFVTLAWWASPRLIFPLVALNILLTASAVAGLLLGRFRLSGLVCGGVLAAALFWRVPGAWEQTQDRMAETRHRWSVSTELVQFLRAQGLREPREAFVFEWTRFLVDDPGLQPFYNFGFWNLVLPKFRDERPVPTPFLDDLDRFAAFMQARGTRFIVVPRWPRRFPALVPLAADQVQLAGYHRAAVLAYDIVYVRDSGELAEEG
jgi:hypothetical protein